MIPEIIGIGRRVEIRILQQMRQKNLTPDKVHVYGSKIADIDYQKSIIYIYNPTSAGTPVILEREIRYVFIFYTESGLYSAEGFCIGRKMDGNIPLNAIAITSDVAKYQRREYYRESCSIPLQFKQIVKDPAKMKDDEIIAEFLTGPGEIKDGTILDISGGGLRFKSDSRLVTGVYSIFRFEIMSKGQPEEMVVPGYMIASDKIDGIAVYHNRTQFIFHSEKEREKIIYFVFNEQRRKRNNS